MFGQLRSACLPLVLIAMVGSLFGQEDAEMDRFAEEGLQLLSRYLRIDSSNPPGNEIETARFLEKRLTREGIPTRVFESAPRRANLVSTLQGKAGSPALLLLQHMDVVPISEGWQFEPFSGALQGDSVHGRGALDMKGLGIAQLVTLLALKRSGLPLDRSVVLVAVADEEMGGQMGLAWLMDNHPELFQNVEMVLAEGGMNLLQEGRLAYVGIETVQKRPLWIRLSVQGGQGHAALLTNDSAPARLVRALNRVLELSWPINVTPPVERFFQDTAPYHSDPLRRIFADIRGAANTQLDPMLLGSYFGALLKNTVSVTVLKAGTSVNSRVPSASADLDCRLLPGEDTEFFLNSVREAINDPAVLVEILLDASDGESPASPRLEAAIESALRESGSDAKVGSSVSPGFTDARFFRAKGIPAYGFTPFRLDDEVGRGVHGRNERISKGDFREGVKLFYRVVRNLAAGEKPALDTTSSNKSVSAQ